MVSSPTTYSPRDLSERYGVGIEKVHGWISTHQLRAVNVATRTSQRPRYRIRQEDLDAFEAARSTTPAPKPQRRRRKADQPVKEYV